MRRFIYAASLLLLLVMATTACNITNLLSQEEQSGSQAGDEENMENSSTVFQDQNNSTKEDKQEKSFIDLVKINPDVKYEIASKDGYFSIGPLNGHITNIKWDTSNSVDFRVNNGERTVISKCIIDEDGVKVKSLIEVSDGGIYINDSLNDSKGLVFISRMKEKNFYFYKNNELKEYKDVEYYFISPLQKYIILFAGDYETKPLLIELASGNEIGLPIEMDHGWPEYAVGISFSADETRIMYEDWSKMELCVYDIKGKKELYRIGENGYSLQEGAFSPNGKMAAYLKYDDSKEPLDLYEGRNPVGHKLVVYDLVNKKVLKEVQGDELVYLKPVWSTDGKYLLFNMAKLQNEKEPGDKLYGSPYLLNISTGKITRLAKNEEGLKYGVAWSDDNKMVMVISKSKSEENRFTAIDIKLGDELDIDNNKYYILSEIKSGTRVYEIISRDNTKLEQFSGKNNAVLSSDDKHTAFKTTIEDKEYLIIAPR